MLAFVAAVLAVVAATLAARGPAVAESSVIAWPPHNTVQPAPERAWVTPLLLARHHAARLDARLPCGSEPAVSLAGPNVLLLATTRNPRRTNGLEVARSTATDSIAIRVGRATLARVPAGRDRSCFLDLRFAGTAWQLRRSDGRTLRGVVAYPPSVVALITELDLTSSPEISATIRTLPQDTRPSGSQTAYRVIAVLLLLTTVGLAVEAPARARRNRNPLNDLTAPDIAVLIVLAIWWIVAPLQDDDGWVRARQTNSLVSGGFSNYYEHWGANLPLATWLEWLQHHVVAHSTSLALHRAPTFVVLVVAWFVCRRCLTLLTESEPASNGTRWTCALCFLLGAVAFGMMLRPEPVIALLSVSVLACCLAYARKPRVTLLAFAAALCSLALTIHPSGVVACAPVLISLPRLLRDVRRGSVPLMKVAAVGVGGVALTLLLAFVDSDAQSRRDSAGLIRGGGGHGGSLLDEIERYRHLAEGGGSVARRLYVGLLLLLVIGFVISLVQRDRTLTQRLPLGSLSLALGSLAITPSKWLWHFGGLIGFCAIAVAYERHRLAARPSRLVPTVVSAGFFVVAGIAATEAYVWGPLSGSRLPAVDIAAPYLGAVLVGAGGLVLAYGLRLVTRPELHLVPVIAASVTAVSIALLSAEAVSPSWSTARQSLASLTGGATCGVASDIVVDVPFGATSAAQPGATRLTLPADGTTRWFPVPESAVGVFLGSGWRPDRRLVVSWGDTSRGTTRELGSGTVDLSDEDSGPNRARWRLVTQDRFPDRPRDADAIRFHVAASRAGDAPELAGPVSYAPVSLDVLLRRTRRRAIVSPYLFEAMPCARLTPLAGGVATVPSLLVDLNAVPSLTNFSSPIAGISHVTDLYRLPARGTPGVTVYVYVARVDPRDVLVPARRRIVLT